MSTDFLSSDLVAASKAVDALAKSCLETAKVMIGGESFAVRNPMTVDAYATECAITMIKALNRLTKR